MAKNASRGQRTTNEHPDFGPTVKAFRQRRGLTKKALADKVQVDASHITRVESGERGVSKELVERIALALDASLQEEHELLRTSGYMTDEAAELLAQPELARLATLLASGKLTAVHRDLLVRQLRLTVDQARALGYEVPDQP
ncbi:MAG: multiprotein-bridging factor 1 family protein [Chloroflexota bacterium]